MCYRRRRKNALGFADTPFAPKRASHEGRRSLLNELNEQIRFDDR